MTTPIASIRDYCVKYGMGKTARLLPSGGSSNSFELEELFSQTASNRVDLMKSLGIVFKGNTEQNEKRDRIRNMEKWHVSSTKPENRAKKERKRKGKEDTREDKIPEGFLALLDELALERKDAEILYKNKEQWQFVKSDRRIFCTEQGINLLIELFTKHSNSTFVLIYTNDDHFRV